MPEAVIRYIYYADPSSSFAGAINEITIFSHIEVMLEKILKYALSPTMNQNLIEAKHFSQILVINDDFRQYISVSSG
jgi:hypothetical protein